MNTYSGWTDLRPPQVLVASHPATPRMELPTETHLSSASVVIMPGLEPLVFSPKVCHPQRPSLYTLVWTIPHKAQQLPQRTAKHNAGGPPACKWVDPEWCVC